MTSTVDWDRAIASKPPTWATLGSALVRRLPLARYRVMNWLCRRSRARFVAQIPGVKSGLRFLCDLRNGLAREVFFMGVYEPQETLVIHRLIGPGGVFVDVGSHWGYFTLIVAEHVGPRGRVMAIEADPRIYAMLERSVALNDLPQVRTIHAAAAAESGTLALVGFDERGDNWGISRIAPAATPASFDVPAVTLDGLLDDLGVNSVDLVKIDIEGAEALALVGMSVGLRCGRYRRLLIELHPTQLAEHGASAASIIELLLQTGYRGWVIDHAAANHRQAAYGRRHPDETMIRPLRWPEPLDDWPHLVFVQGNEPLYIDEPGSGG